MPIAYLDQETAMAIIGDRIYQGQALSTEIQLRSNNNKYEFWYQVDGNAVIYVSGPDGKRPIWATNTWNKVPPGLITLYPDANLEMRLSTGSVVWETGVRVPAPADASLIMQDDGNLVVYRNAHTTPVAVWASGSVQS